MLEKKCLNLLKKIKIKKIFIFEIPLLIESKLKKYFDIIIFIKSKKIRFKRYKKKREYKNYSNLLEIKST